MGVEILPRMFLTFFSHFFYKDDLLDFWNLWKWNRYVSLALMGVEILPRMFLTFFSHFFYKDVLLLGLLEPLEIEPVYKFYRVNGSGDFAKNVFNVLFFSF